MQKYLFEEFLITKYTSKRTGKLLQKIVVSNVTSRCKKIEHLLLVDLDVYCANHDKFNKLKDRIKLLHEIGVSGAIIASYLYSLRLYFIYKNGDSLNE